MKFYFKSNRRNKLKDFLDAMPEEIRELYKKIFKY